MIDRLNVPDSADGAVSVVPGTTKHVSGVRNPAALEMDWITQTVYILEKIQLICKSIKVRFISLV